MLDASFEDAYDELFIASADGDLLVVDLHVRGRECIYLILCHDEAAVYADEVVPGQQLFDGAELEFGEDVLIPGGYANIFPEAFDIKYLVEKDLYLLLAYGKEEIGPFPGLGRRREGFVVGLLIQLVHCLEKAAEPDGF